jgi:hypothetical protein
MCVTIKEQSEWFHSGFSIGPAYRPPQALVDEPTELG